MCIFDAAVIAHTGTQPAPKAVSPVKNIPDMRLGTDNSTQYNSCKFKKSMQTLEIRHEFVWKDALEQNGHSKSFYGTLKKEHVWPHESARFQDAEVVLAKTCVDCNEGRIHFALGSCS